MTRNVYLTSALQKFARCFRSTCRDSLSLFPLLGTQCPCKIRNCRGGIAEYPPKSPIIPLFLGTPVPRKLRKFRGGLAEYPRRARGERGERGEPVSRKNLPLAMEKSGVSVSRFTIYISKIKGAPPTSALSARTRLPCALSAFHTGHSLAFPHGGIYGGCGGPLKYSGYLQNAKTFGRPLWHF